MKTNLRFILIGVLIAVVAALGLSHGAWASPLMQVGTVPNCVTSENATGTTCYATATGGNFTLTDVAMPGNDTSVPGAKNNGPAVDLETNGNLITLCFPDTDTPPVGNIYYWVATATPGYWQYWPTYHTTNPSMSCTLTSLSGIYTIVY